MERAQQAWSSWGRRWARRAHLTRVGGRRQGFTPLSSLFSLVLLLTLLAASAGWGMPMMMQETQADDMSEGSLDIFPLGLIALFAVAIIFILLAAGVNIENPALGCFRPPDKSAGRIFLAVLGVFVLVPAGWQLLRVPTSLEGARQFISTMTSNTSRLLGGLDNPESLPKIHSLNNPLTTADLLGRVSFEHGSAYQQAFQEHHSNLKIHVAAGNVSFEVDVKPDGKFTLADIPVSVPTVTVEWRAHELGDYVLWPMKIKVGAPISQDEGRTDVSFDFKKIGDILDERKEEAITAIQANDVERADKILTALLVALKRFDDRGPGPNSPAEWPRSVYNELADKLEGCQQDTCLMFERKWRRGAIERAVTLKSRVSAMNAWAGYSKLYRPEKPDSKDRKDRKNRQDWADSTLTKVKLEREEYRDFLREDLQLVMKELAEIAENPIRELVSDAIDLPVLIAETPVRELVSDAIDLPAVTDCLDNGQQVALRSFGSLLSAGFEKVYLNRVMNVISGLHLIVKSECSQSRVGLIFAQGARRPKLLRKNLHSHGVRVHSAGMNGSDSRG